MTIPVKKEKEKETEKEEVKETPKEAELKKIHALEPEAINGVAPLSIFDEKPKDVDYINLFQNSTQKAISKIANAKTIEDLLTDAVFETILGALEFWANALKEKRQKEDEASNKMQKNRDNYIENSLKSKGLNRNALSSRLAYRMQEWLSDASSLPRNPDGSLKTNGLTRNEKFQYRKFKFAQSLPIIAGENVYDFPRFSQSQKRQYARYMRIYAMENPAFLKYVVNMFETGVKKEELNRIYQVACDMNLKFNTGLKYSLNSRERIA